MAKKKSKSGLKRMIAKREREAVMTSEAVQTAITLREKQSQFVRCLALLFQFAELSGWAFTMGEGYIGDSINSPEETTPHMRHGNHFNRLGQDLNLFVEGEWVDEMTDQWKELGEFWERLDPMCRWGGHWGDPNHFSMEHRGVA